MLIELVATVLVLVGGAFALLGSIGLARLPDVFTRLHGPTKATTLGVGAVVLASLAHSGGADAGLSLRELAITLFLFITAPVSAHLVAKAALKEMRSSPEATAPGETPGPAPDRRA
jgi:multicomponent K+:H+ antiporter subunit G